MRKFNSFELSRLQDTQESTMQDECTIGRYTVVFDSLGDEIATFIPISGVSCGFKFVGTDEVSKGQYMKVDFDAIIRLPMDTEITSNDRVTIIKRFGITQSGIQYSVNGNPLIGSSCIQVELKLV